MQLVTWHCVLSNRRPCIKIDKLPVIYIFRYTFVLRPITVSHIYGPRHKKTCLREFANNTGADQPAHSRRLISAYVIRLLESIICKLATGELSIF